MFEALKNQFERAGSIDLSIRVRPGAAKTEIKEIMSDGSIKIAIAAPPEENAANEELVRFLAEEFSVDRSRMEIIAGRTSRKKLVRIVRW